MNTIKGNLLDAKGLIVHGCNAQGIMGSGVALAIKDKWPVVFKHYRQAFEMGQLPLGAVQFVAVESGVMVVNAITQYGYGRDGKRYVNYEAVAKAFEQIRDYAEDFGQVVNFPLLGAGLGGGDWEIISTIINRTLGDEVVKNLWVQ